MLRTLFTRMSTATPNRLIHEKSLYLQQHAHNPVNWYPWGREAWETARSLRRPIFLSIGYSTCHWCHVMETESFEDKATASILNEHFVSIKVDREERPDIDQQYMSFVLAMHGSGGWPLNLFLVPDTLKPFYGGTYFPLHDRPGMPSFKFLLSSIVKQWKESPASIVSSSERLCNALEEHLKEQRSASDVSDNNSISQASKTLFFALSRIFDAEYGGFGRDGPKFPTPSQLFFLLACARRAGPAFQPSAALLMVHKTLYMIAHGGIRDHLAGGFHRYSVDRFWYVPHYEKMLYDQAQLLAIFAEARLCIPTGNFRFIGGEEITREHLVHVYEDAMRELVAYVSSRLLDLDTGLFYSAEDADSQVSVNDSSRVEGAYYTWTRPQIEAIIKDPKDIEYFFANYDLHVDSDQQVLFRKSKRGESGRDERLKRLLHLLDLDKQKNRPRCLVDRKIVLSWNAMMVKGLAQASVLEPSWLSIATKAMNSLLSHAVSRDESGKVCCDHIVYTDKDNVKIAGFASDYACLVDALLTLYDYVPSEHVRFHDVALELQKTMDSLFFSADRPSGYSMTETGQCGMDKKEHFSLSLILSGNRIDSDGAEPGLHGIVLGNIIRQASIAENSRVDIEDYEQIRAMVTNALQRDGILSSPFFIKNAMALETQGRSTGGFLSVPSTIRIEAPSMDLIQEAVDLVHRSGLHMPFCFLSYGTRSSGVSISICQWDIGCLAPMYSIQDLKAFLSGLSGYSI